MTYHVRFVWEVTKLTSPKRGPPPPALLSALKKVSFAVEGSFHLKKLTFDYSYYIELYEKPNPSLLYF